MSEISETISPIRVKGIDHVTLIVKDLARSKQFYVETLGMQPVDRPGFSFDGSWFQAGGTQVHLILEHENSGPAGENTVDQKKSSRNRHFAFEIEDGHEAATKLQQLGIELFAGPQLRPDGAIQVFVNDPDGYVVELCSPPAR